jgi:Bacterial protein of unknown function (DUF885)
MRVSRFTVAIAFVVAGCCVWGCQKQQDIPTPRTEDWNAFLTAFEDTYFTANPAFAVYQGRHEFDGKLPDWTADAIKNWVMALRTLRERATAVEPSSLDEKQQFERQYVIAVIDGELFWLDTAQWPFKNPRYYAGALDPNVYLMREYAPLGERLKAYIAYARVVPVALEQIKANLRTPLPRPYVDIGKLTFGGLADYYERDVPPLFSSVTDSTLQADFRTANEGAIRSMRGITQWLDAQRANATGSFALGADLFSAMLKQTGLVDVPLDELERVGRQDLARNVTALREACAAYAPGKPILGCIAKSNANKPVGGTAAAARRQLDELKAFVADGQLVTIPGPEQARVQQSPPYQRYNFAYIDVPGPYEQGLPSIYYVAPPDPAWSKAEQQEYMPGRSHLLFTSVHEVWPGHFLQFLHSNRSQSRFGRNFLDYAFVEGWAHYAEEMMWDAGLGRGDPETHIGQLQNALLRNARYLSAIGLHARGMTTGESERLFREQAFQDPATARQQAARGTFDPAYLNYTLGKLMIRKLRDDWTASRGGRSAWKQFHDTFLSYGGPPIPLIRNAMLGGNAGPLLN